MPHKGAFLIKIHNQSIGDFSMRTVPQAVKDAYAESAKYFQTPLQQFQFYDKYSRFNYELGRRETWVETVTRAVDFLRELSEGKLDNNVYERIHEAILNMQVMPSMRLLAMAGEAARRSHITCYNCSYVVVDSIDSFVEALIISMNGCGVGYSVEREHVQKLPRVSHRTGSGCTFEIQDTTEGWADALRFGLESWFRGDDVGFQYHLIRPAGSPLRVKGGRASGPEPLRKMLDFARDRIQSRRGEHLRPLDAHDIMCMVGEAAVAGGVRRTAMISLFDYDDLEMRHCKDGDLSHNQQRWNANNSAVWPDRHLSQAEIMRFMLDIFESGRGEPGIFSRKVANLTKAERREECQFGVNPCSELFLRPSEFCNLSSVVCRESDTLFSLQDKVELATIIGTIQSMALHLPGLRQEWINNCEEERLLGVDLNGQMDCPAVQNGGTLAHLKQVAVETNKTYAEKLGINQSASVTCVKPSGNSSQLLNSSSGLHSRWSPYYIRNVRVSTHSPIFKVFKEAGVPMDVENGQSVNDATTYVVHFPVKSPDGAVTNNGRTALQQCEYWLLNKVNYTEHNPSITVTYKPDEVMDLAKWVYEHQDLISGMAFLPSSDARYDQMPYEEINQAMYEYLMDGFPEIDFSRIYLYEETDLTTAAQELACMSGLCEI
jgi:ribonucleoside-triphosphate reductase (thioredoxin)